MDGKTILSQDIIDLAHAISLNPNFCAKQGDCNNCVLYRTEKCGYTESAQQAYKIGYRLTNSIFQDQTETKKTRKKKGIRT